MILNPPTRLPPRDATCLLIYRIEEGNAGAGLDETHSIGYHDGVCWHDVHDASTNVGQWLEGWALIELSKPPPNFQRVRIVVDVSPPLAGGHRSVYAVEANEEFTDPARDAEPTPDGWRRSIVVADVPVPEPIAEIAGAVEAP